MLGALLIGLVPLPGTSSVTVPMSPPIACGQCHGDLDEQAIFDTWAGSVMSHAGRDPVFLAALNIAEQDVPGVGDFCLRCHTPENWLEGRCEPTDGSALDYFEAGVSCSACHRMEPNPWVRNAQYIVADDSVMRGPYVMSDAPHQNTFSTWISDSRLCGTCHNLINPLVRRRTLTGTLTPYFFPEQATYLEWEASAFNRGPDPKGCIPCHMPDVPGQAGNTGPVRPDRSSHELSGVNTFLLEAIDLLYPDLGFASQLARGRARILAQLRAAATLEVLEAPAMVSRGASYAVRLRVTNQAGHKLPTGYPEGRRVFLSAVTSSGAAVYDRATGEPIAPLAIYHAVQGQAGLGPGHHIALNDTIFEDTRIPPRGMISTATIAPVGKVYPEAAPGELAHWDDLTLTATAPCDLLQTQIDGRAALWYQVLTPRYANTLIEANRGNPRGDALQAAFQTLDPQPLEMTAVRFTIAIDPASSCAPPDAGVVDAGEPDQGFLPDAIGQRDAQISPLDAGPEPMEVGGGCGCRAAAPRASRSHRNPTDGRWYLLVLLCAAWASRRRRKDPT